MEQYKKQEIQKKVQFTFRCLKCNSIIEEHFEYCPECGNALKKQCPKCGKPLRSSDSELCENCGEWLLKNQCRFCYAPISDTDSFCSNCGLPTDGIECPKCKTKSFFHFCKNCNEPLTEFAYQMIKKLQDNSFKPEEMKEKEEINFSNNQEARTYYQAQLYLLEKELQLEEKKLLEESKILEEQKKLNEKEILDQYKNYISQTEPKKKEKKLLFSEDQMNKIFEKGEEVKKEIERIEEEKREERRRKKLRRKIEKEQKKELEKLVNSKKRKTPIGWICNAFSTFHPAPAFFYDCADPSLGGEWVFEDSNL